MALVVDDDLNTRNSLADLVEAEGFEVKTADSLERARNQVAHLDPLVVLTDLVLPDGQGTDLLKDLEEDSHTEVILVTGFASVESAVEALRLGAYDYLTKPIDVPRLKAILANVSRTRELKEEITNLRDQLRDLGRFGPLVGTSDAMQQVYDLITRVAPTDASVFVIGESGTGKELVAQTVHQLSKRAKKPFLPLNCGAVSANLIESELFGHEKGSFTGASRRHHGYFERADGGTLFLDEITEMPVELQVKLLRVLETRQFVRVGGSDQLEVDVRVLSATNREPEEAVKEGKLREDLLYRLKVFPIYLPPLREREEDVEHLAEHFLDELNKEVDGSKRFSAAAVERLLAHSWPGNVRELQNAVRRAYILADKEITPEMLPEDLAKEAREGGKPKVHVQVGSSLAEAEKRLILATLAEHDDDKKAAAKVLGVSTKTLYNRIKSYEKEKEEQEGDEAGGED